MRKILSAMFSSRKQFQNPNVLNTIGFGQIQSEILHLLNMGTFYINDVLDIHKCFSTRDSTDPLNGQYIKTLEYSFIEEYLKDPNSEKTFEKIKELKESYKK